MLHLNNSKTSFKIGGIVGIIILLLGITVMFGVFQMSKVSKEIIEISEEYFPLNEITTDIRYNKSNQALKFEQIIRFSEKNVLTSIEKAKEEFWSSAGVIDSDLSRGKKIIKAGIDTSSGKTKLKFQNLDQKMSNFEQNYRDYERLARDAFFISELNGFNGNDIIIEQIQLKEVQLQESLLEILQFLSFYTDESTGEIESNEKDSLMGQILIVFIAGAIAGTLGFFLTRINKDLKNEVEVKTVELRKANEKLKEMDKLKDEFIGIASHELKSPIQPIFGFAELAKSGDIDQKEAWDGVTQLATKLQDLANDLLDVSKIESNRLNLQKEKFRINDFVLEIIQTLKINLKEGIYIRDNLDRNIVIEADKVRLGQVFRNILSNALKFTSKGKIKIKTLVFEDENKIVFKISDSGTGISKDMLPRIFEKFVTKNKQNENKSGTGLGLFLCKGIVEAHGGEITARNNADCGATFEFSLPIFSKEKISESVEVFTN